MRQSQSTFATPESAQRPALRFTPVIHLQSGEAVLQAAETVRQFEERPLFGPAGAMAIATETDSPADWISGQVETIARLAHGQMQERPIIITLPLVALVHPDTPQLCDDAMRRSPLCPQEICFEISDAALSLPGVDAQAGIEALRSRGFRVSVDATASWQAPLHPALCLLLDNLRVDACRLDNDADLLDQVDAAVASGMSVIACRAAWRDQDWLADLGIEYAIRPRADA